MGISMWRKVLCFALSMCMLFSFVAIGGSSAKAKQINVESFGADNYGIEIGKSARVTFSAKINGESLNSKVAVFDSNDNFVTKLTRASNGEYLGDVQLSATKKATNVYHLKVDDQKFGEHEIRFYKELSDADMQENAALWARINRLRDSLQNLGASNEEIVKSVYDFLSNNPEIETLRYENEKTLNFETYTGICNAFSIREEKSDEEIEATKADMEEVSEVYYQENETKLAPSKKDIGVYAPYYGVESDFTKKYITMAESVISKAMGGNVYGYYGNGSYGYPKATVVSFKNWNKYGLIMVDSHGMLYSNKVAICISNEAKGSYDSADVSQGHLGYDAYGVFLMSTYIKKYCGTLPGSIVYMGICYGMYNSTMYSTLLNMGASTVIGFTNPVSFYYDNQMMDAFFRQLSKTDTETNQLYTIAEAAQSAIAKHGETDPYSSYKAKFVYQGSGTARLTDATSGVPVTSVSLQDGITLTEGEKIQLTVSISPNNASDYTVEFESIHPDTASVTPQGLVTAHEAGAAKIICSVIDNVSNKTFYADCTITVESGVPTYTVYFRDWNGSLIDIQVVEEGDDAVLPDEPEREGYIFRKWDGDHRNITEDTTITAVYVQIGDANDDGKVNTGDATYILNYAIGNVELSELFEMVADSNGDGLVNSGDAIKILLLTIG